MGVYINDRARWVTLYLMAGKSTAPGSDSLVMVIVIEGGVE